MSRGLGAVQRAVLDVLAAQCNHVDGWLTLTEITACVVGPGVSRSETESVRRAVKQLGRKGLAEVEYWNAWLGVRAAKVDRGDFYIYRRPHAGMRLVLAAHWPLSVEERDARGQLWADHLERLVALDARIGQTH